MSGGFLSFDVVYAQVRHPKLCNEEVNKLVEEIYKVGLGIKI